MVPVIGNGSKIVVNIGDKGEVEGVIRNWKAFTSKRELKSTEIKTMAEMEKEFQALVASQFGKEAKAEVKRSYVLYFDKVMRNPAEKLNLAGVDAAGVRIINGNKATPDRKPQPTDKGD
jgi:hypothetical protein